MSANKDMLRLKDGLYRLLLTDDNGYAEALISGVILPSAISVEWKISQGVQDKHQKNKITWRIGEIFIADRISQVGGRTLVSEDCRLKV